MTLQPSRYVFTKGNLDLNPAKYLVNEIDINTHMKMTEVSFSYCNFVYFDNYFHRYYADDNYLYIQIVNNENYIGNSFSLTVSQRLFDEKLRIKLKGMYDYCTLSENLYHCFFDAFHCYFKIDYYLHKWHFFLFCHPPYENYNIPSSSYKLERLKSGCPASWSNDKWLIGIQAYNMFSKYQKVYSYKTYDCFYMRIDPCSMFDGQEINIKAVYNIGYGKRTEREVLSSVRKTNSAILKSY